MLLNTSLLYALSTFGCLLYSPVSYILSLFLFVLVFATMHSSSVSLFIVFTLMIPRLIWFAHLAWSSTCLRDEWYYFDHQLSSIQFISFHRFSSPSSPLLSRQHYFDFLPPFSSSPLRIVPNLCVGLDFSSLILLLLNSFTILLLSIPFCCCFFLFLVLVSSLRISLIVNTRIDSELNWIVEWPESESQERVENSEVV